MITARYFPGIIMSVSMFERWSGAAMPSSVLRPESDLGEACVDSCGNVGFSDGGCGVREVNSTGGAVHSSVLSGSS